MDKIDSSSSKIAKQLAFQVIGKYVTDKKINTQKMHVFKDENKFFVSNDIVSMESHNESYNDILKAYSSNLNKNLQFKNDCKALFFYLCLGVMIIICLSLVIVLGVITYMTFAYQHLSFQISNIIAIVTAIGTAFISAFFIIPKIITEYLFNLKEEENMMKIVQNIQRHDLSIRKDIKDYNKKDSSITF